MLYKVSFKKYTVRLQKYLWEIEVGHHNSSQTLSVIH